MHKRAKEVKNYTKEILTSVNIILYLGVGTQLFNSHQQSAKIYG